MASFLTVPLKKTNEVDLAKPVRTFISSTYSTEETASVEIEEAINELNKLRNKAVIQPLDNHESSLDLITRYYDQLVAIENKLPLTPTQIPIAFKWKDAFDKGSLFFGRQSLTLSYGSFERAAVLFNIGALMSRIAAAQALTTDEELKTTAKLFQQGAGVFSHLKDCVLSLVQQEPTPDLMPDTLNALSALMVAQAQEAIYLKAAKDKMKPALLVKIAAQCHDFYQEAVKQLSREIVKSLWDKEWIATLNGKMMAFNGLAQYHQSLANNENKEIGEELSRLQESLRLLQQAQSYFASAGLSAFSTEQGIIQKAFDTAKKDNDFIYHERIPEFRTLAGLPRASLAKPLPVTTPMSPRFKAVHQALIASSGRKAQVVNMETGRLREYTQLLNGILASLNLPAALDDITNYEALPESIREKSAKVKADGGVQEIRKLIDSLPDAMNRNKDLLEQTSKLLTEEKQSDDQLRSQFKEKWSRMESAQLTEPLWQEIGKYRAILDTASNADSVVKQKFAANEKGIELLSKTESELKAAIPSLAAKTDSQSTPSVAKLRGLIKQVDELTKERDGLENDIKAVSFDMSAEFLAALSDSGAVNEEQLSTDKLNEKFGPLREKVSESIKRQENLVEEIQNANNQFCMEKAGTASGAERENMLKMLAASHDAFTELRSNLKEGTKFYGDLTPLLVRLQEKVSDFCFARKTEKEDLMRDLQQNIVSQPTNAAPTPNYHNSTETTTTTSSGRPARPPPPVFSQAPTQQQQPHPIHPPRNTVLNQAPTAPSQQQQPATQQQYAMPPQPYPQQPYAPQPQVANYQQPYAGPAYPFAQQQGYPAATPYPMAYPGTYPGAGAAVNAYNPYGYQQMPYPQQPPQPNQPYAPQQPPQYR